MSNLNKKFLKKMRKKLGPGWPYCPCCGSNSNKKMRKLIKKLVKKQDKKEDLLKGLEELDD